MQDVGCPDPAAVVDIIERMLSLRAFSLIASMLEADCPAVVVTLMKSAPLPARISRNRILHRQGCCPRVALGDSSEGCVGDPDIIRIVQYDQSSLPARWRQKRERMSR